MLRGNRVYLIVRSGGMRIQKQVLYEKILIKSVSPAIQCIVMTEMGFVIIETGFLWAAIVH